jgi:hypothetical protein
MDMEDLFSEITQVSSTHRWKSQTYRNREKKGDYWRLRRWWEKGKMLT